MIKKLDHALFANSNIIFINEVSISVTFFGGEMSILSVYLDKINLDDVNFDEDDPEIIIHTRLMAWRNIFKQHKSSKKDISKELVSVA